MKAVVTPHVAFLGSGSGGPRGGRDRPERGGEAAPLQPGGDQVELLSDILDLRLHMLQEDPSLLIAAHWATSWRTFVFIFPCLLFILVFLLLLIFSPPPFLSL